jgi:NAD(P)-dependent dehydrogenase (short-subunit alcohol dehydrogenase family)
MRIVVTGANRGIGEEVAKQLAAEGHEVIGTTRARLDLADPASIASFADGVDRLDALVANAATALDGFDEAVARDTLATNFRGNVALVEALLPKLGDGGRVVLVSSGMGELSRFSGDARRALEDPDADLLALGDRFVREVGQGVHARSGWPSSAYSTSKGLLNAYARHLARRVADDPRGLRVVAVCPGWVRTRMGGSSAPRSVHQGARGIAWAASAPDVPASGFFRDRRPIPW